MERWRDGERKERDMMKRWGDGEKKGRDMMGRWGGEGQAFGSLEVTV